MNCCCLFAKLGCFSLHAASHSASVSWSEGNERGKRRYKWPSCVCTRCDGDEFFTSGQPPSLQLAVNVQQIGGSSCDPTIFNRFSNKTLNFNCNFVELLEVFAKQYCEWPEPKSGAAQKQI